MNTSRIVNICAAAALLLVLSACSTAPTKLQGDFANVSVTESTSGQWNGSMVRWGGLVVGGRLTDAGACLEVAEFPLDRVTLEPYVRSPGDNLLFLGWKLAYTPAGSAATPRFLACDQAFDTTTYHAGAVVTMSGYIGTMQNYNVAPDKCEPGSRNRPRTADYSANITAVSDSSCQILLPTLIVATAYAWKEKPAGGSISKPDMPF